MGFRRTYDAFFDINPDLLPYKDILLSEVTEELLVLLPYVSLRAQGNEIQLALRAWKKFCTSKYHFVVIGDCPSDLISEFGDWVEFIPLEKIPKHEGQYNPHLDIQHKMEEAYRLFKDKYNGFVWMVDDNYAIKPFCLAEILSIHSHASDFTGEKEAPTYFWKHDKWKTRQLLEKERFSHINYTTHFPCYFEFEKLKELWDKYDMRNNSFVIEDIYFNSFRHEVPIPDDKIRFGVWSKKGFDEELSAAIADPNIKFICNSVEGWSPELERILERIIYG